MLVCLITGVLSGLEVYAAQLIWGSKPFSSDNVESAFALVSGKAGGLVLFQIVNFTLLIANMGSGMGSQLAAGRLLYGMGRGNALPKSFFGAIEPKRRIPRNNIVAVGAFALAGAGLLEFFANRLGGGAYEIGAQCLNFGAFIAFMGVNAAAFVHHWRLVKSDSSPLAAASTDSSCLPWAFSSALSSGLISAARRCCWEPYGWPRASPMGHIAPVASKPSWSLSKFRPTSLEPPRAQPQSEWQCTVNVCS